MFIKKWFAFLEFMTPIVTAYWLGHAFGWSLMKVFNG